MQTRITPLALAVALASVGACSKDVRLRAPERGPGPLAPMERVIPAPVSTTADGRAVFTFTATTAIQAQQDEEVQRVARYLADLVGSAVGTKRLPVENAASPQPAGTVQLTLSPASATGDEGYEMTIGADRVTIVAARAAGLFYGVQTLRQLMPAWVEYRGAVPDKARPLVVPAGRIVDRPRFAWRGAMLDVARHFFGPEDVKRYVDLIALHKINRLHLHLSDDQGWRIEITSWPNLTTHGGSTAVGGGSGGYYTQAAYRDLVSYARDRFVTIVPEIDMPGHTNAALSSYPDLNCDGVAPALYTGINVGFSTLCVDKPITFTFIDDVVREIGAMTAGPYFHVGGDEVEKLTPQQYRQFIERVQAIVAKHGKQMIGWDEIAPATLLPSTIVQHWRPKGGESLAKAPALILSPANRAYLDMKYDRETALGLAWAGYVDLRTAYDWDPSTLVANARADAVLGVEAPLWSETLVSMRDVEYMAFPRLAAIAELGWSPATARNWDGFVRRLGALGPRYQALGVNFHRVPDVGWER
jgi:hexosaminidase